MLDAHGSARVHNYTRTGNKLQGETRSPTKLPKMMSRDRTRATFYGTYSPRLFTIPTRRTARFPWYSVVVSRLPTSLNFAGSHLGQIFGLKGTHTSQEAHGTWGHRRGVRMCPYNPSGGSVDVPGFGEGLEYPQSNATARIIACSAGIEDRPVLTPGETPLGSVLTCARCDREHGRKFP